VIRQRVALLVLSAVACAAPSSGPGPWTLSLPNAGSIRVLAVRSERFVDGDVLHLFYQSDSALSDTVALRARARAIWPAFAPYVIGAGYRISGITAVHPVINIGSVSFGVHRTTRWGIVAREDSASAWRLDGDTAILPAPIANPKPMVNRDGVPLRVRPAGSARRAR
jgi:hypothetical protein